MKRLIVFILLTLLLCGVNFTFTKNLNIDDIFSNVKIEVFTNEKTSLSLKKIDNGVGEVIFCDAQEFDYILKGPYNVAGYTLKIYGVNESEVLKKLNVKNIYNKNFGIYGWSSILNNLNKKIKIDDKIINFQCISKENSVIIGVPILLGSY